ncbi:MAG: S26 family signal peptidase [Candidatus Thermoplasmatota archaeon]
MERETREEIISIGRDVVVSLIIICVVLGSLYAYTGRWPPLVVVESGSMSHDTQVSEVGVIDAGDIVMVREREKEDITTYVEGRATGYKKYGQYGDVIVFRPDGNRERTPVIHRAVLYLEYDEGRDEFNIPSLAELEYREDWEISGANPDEVEDGRGLDGSLTIYDYGYKEEAITINLEDVETSGFITKGDHNPSIDQDRRHRGINEPVREEWMLGKARGELPWFGILKLAYLGRTEDIPSNSWTNLIISITAIILLPLILELGSRLYKEGKEEPEEEDKNPKDEMRSEDFPKGGEEDERYL